MTFILWQHVCDQFSAMQNSSYTLVFDVSGHDLIFLQNIIANKKKWEHTLKKRLMGLPLTQPVGSYITTLLDHTSEREARCDKDKNTAF